MNLFHGFSSYDWEQIKCSARAFVFLIILIILGVFGSRIFDNVDAVQLAEAYRQRVFVFRYAPNFILVAIASIFNWWSLAYMLAPLLAFSAVMLAGAFYVKDIYALPSFVDGLKYVLASMFGFRYPVIVIEKGEVKPSTESVDLIDKIGGPGMVIIEPGNAVMFRSLMKPSGISVGTSYFLAPFERKAQIVNLDDQQGDREEVDAITRDGIRVKVRDIHFRYRIQQQRQENGQPVRRTLDNPYPFPEKALRNMVFNLQVQRNDQEKRDELDKWTAAVERAVVGVITDFVASHSIDYLTAPREGGINPQAQMKDELLYSNIRRSLEAFGAELIWADVGHIDITRPEVDDQRASLWAADWVSNSKVIQAFGEARRQAYSELGRAEAQAEIIIGIADALESANLSDRTVDNVRRIFLARTAQILDAINSTAQNTPEEKKNDNGK